MKSMITPLSSSLSTAGAALLLTAASLLIGAASAGAQTAPAPQAAQSTLPGGASSLQETYQDWQVSCGVTQAGKVCAMSQVQTQQNGQRILAIEIRPAKDNSAAGMLVLPFGLKLEDGATLKIDSNPAALSQLKFSTCLPAGCLLPLNFTAANVTALKAGTVLNVSAKAIDAADLATLPISLKGFAQALDRLAQLVKN